MHQHTGAMPVRHFSVLLYGPGGVHEIRVDSPCACGMAEFVKSLVGLPFTPEFMTIAELSPVRE